MAWDEQRLPDLTGRWAVVTGGNSGIGLHTALQLAAHGARVTLAVRDLDRGRTAMEQIHSRSPTAEVDIVRLDLADMSSVSRCADELVGRREPLDVLVNNAGVMAPPQRTFTRNGFELQFGTNHLGHFALTGLLLPALLRATAPRVVTVASRAHHDAGPDVLDGNATGPYQRHRAYANSKLANLLFALQLQKNTSRLELPLTSTAAHPGICATELAADREGMGDNWLVRTASQPVLKLFVQSAAAGARASLFAATAAEPGSYTGPQRFGETRGEIGPASMSELARDETLARRLWEASEQLTGLRYAW
jgi:NAD(P)-dependent dehydrogenase (short-subunit alcohol dehydrogenase family)